MEQSRYHPILRGAEPFFFKGNDTGILLVHGLTGTPKEMRPLGEYLADKGYTVHGIRLQGHATNIDDLKRTHWEDWLNSVEDGYYHLHNTTRKTFMVGISMGGVLALLAAAQLAVAGVAALSTPFALPPDPRLPWVKYLALIQPELAKQSSDWQDQAMASQHIEYPTYPTRSIAELYELLKAMRTALPRITAPVLLIHSRADGSIAFENMQQIYDHLRTSKDMVDLQHSGHNMTCDLEKEQVFLAIHQFIQKVDHPAA